jgi:DGQHR domain-containing protein
MTAHVLRLPALQLVQGGRRVVSFAVDGPQLHTFAAVSRVHRDTDQELRGYQRPEALAHIRGIRRYLERHGAMLPNAIVVAFDQRVRFEPLLVPSPVDYAVPGELVIPVDSDQPEHERPAWIVDGQQRAAALRDASLTGPFAVAVVGFTAESEEEQRSQFLLVNNTKPLPAGLVNELLPGVDATLPPAMAARRLPAAVVARLNTASHAFAGRIRTTTCPDGYITGTAVLRMIRNSLTDGALYQYRDPATGMGDLDAITAHLDAFWSAVAEVWADQWELPPRKSRLTHGAGIQALGFVMDHITEDTPAAGIDRDRLRVQLNTLAAYCAWTAGRTWVIDEERRRWDGIQNTPQDVHLLKEHLVRQLPNFRAERVAS